MNSIFKILFIIKMSETDTLTDQDEINIKNKYEDFDDDQNINMQNLSKNEILNNYFEEPKWNKASNCKLLILNIIILCFYAAKIYFT